MDGIPHITDIIDQTDFSKTILNEKKHYIRRKQTPPSLSLPIFSVYFPHKTKIRDQPMSEEEKIMLTIKNPVPPPPPHLGNHNPYLTLPRQIFENTIELTYQKWMEINKRLEGSKTN